MSEWLVVLGAGRWQISGIRAAKAAGLKVLAIDADANAPGLRDADRSAIVDLRNPDLALTAVRNAGITPAGAVAFVTEAGVRTAAALREAFNLPGIRPPVALLVTDKGHQRRVWSAKGLPCPRWFCVDNENAAAAAMTMLTGKTIFKPVDSAGSRGITVVPSGGDWRQAYAFACEGSHSGRVVIEEFITAIEYTVETFSYKDRCAVLAVSEKRKVPGTNDTVAVELATPAASNTATEEIAELAVRALSALGYDEGPGHTEILRDTQGALWLVESAGRGGGFMVADGIVPRASGYNLADASARQAAGLPFPAPQDGDRQAFVLRFVPSRPGLVKSVAGIDEANALDGISCEALVAPGDRVKTATTDGGRLAYILSWAPGRDEAIALAGRAEASLRIEIV
jgi:biotin carboxylase